MDLCVPLLSHLLLFLLLLLPLLEGPKPLLLPRQFGPPLLNLCEGLWMGGPNGM
jgi:hypothetical protein